MRLQPAIALDDFQDNVSGFGDWESRQARREARKSRRQQRRQDRRERRQDKKSARQERRADRRENRQEKRTDRRENRQERRLDRVRRKQAKVREKLVTTASAPVRRALVRRPAEPSLQPAPASMSQAQRPPVEPEWIDDAWDLAENVLDAELEPEEDLRGG